MQENNLVMLSPQEFADRLSISRWTVYAWLQEARIRSVKIGRLVRIPESELERIIQEGSREVLGT
ncbi:MAG: helix-turn-helix domain-containing protein [Nitrososphaerales archaeon]